MTTAEGEGRGVSGGRALAGLGRSLSGRSGRLVAALRRRAVMPSWHAVRDFFVRQVEAETEARSSFFLVPAAMMFGIALVYGLGLRLPLALVLPVAMLLLLLALHLRNREAAGLVCLAVGFVAVGSALAGIELARVRTTTFSGEATVRIEGIVAGRERDERGRERYLVEIRRTERPVLSRPPEKAQVLVSSRHEPIPIGGTYKGLVRLRAPSGPAYPGGYDFAFGTYFDGLGAYGFALGPPDPPAADAAPPAPTVGQRLLALRLWISERIRGTIGGAQGAVAAALITGDRAGIPEDVNRWLRTTGLSHVLSISGLHMALVAGFAMWVVRALLAAIPLVALTLPVKKVAAVAALCVASFYLLISGSNVATDRSFIMLSIMLVAILCDRPALTLRNIAIAAMIVLAISPHAMMTASFQMSFGATAALLGVYGAYASWSTKRGSDERQRGPIMRALLFLIGLGASSLIAGTATGPFAAYHFQRIAPFGLFANMVALPLFSLWIMPLALISMVLMPFGLDQPFLVLMGYGLSVVFEIAHFLHDRLPDSPTGLMTPTSLVLLSVALVLACFLSSKFRWVALPIAALGLVVAPDRAEKPELLIFEDGKEIALIDDDGTLTSIRKRPNDFVFSQWQRAFVGRVDAGEGPSADRFRPFACEAVEEEVVDRSAATASEAAGEAIDPLARTTAHPAPAKVESIEPTHGKTRAIKPKRQAQLCRATTRSGLNVVWTDDYRKLGLACDEADIAIVARAVRRETCRSGALLVTLRTLRKTGSLTVFRAAAGQAEAISSITKAPKEWNLHRLAPWPEFWRKTAEAGDGQKQQASRPTLNTSGSARPAGPAP